MEKDKNILMYEEIKIYQDIENKLGMRGYSHAEYNTVSDLKWVMKNGGFAAYSSEEIFFIRINSELRSVMPMIKINFQINKDQMTVNKV